MPCSIRRVGLNKACLCFFFPLSLRFKKIMDVVLQSLNIVIAEFWSAMKKECIACFTLLSEVNVVFLVQCMGSTAK